MASQAAFEAVLAETQNQRNKALDRCGILMGQIAQRDAHIQSLQADHAEQISKRDIRIAALEGTLADLSKPKATPASRIRRVK